MELPHDARSRSARPASWSPAPPRRRRCRACRARRPRRAARRWASCRAATATAWPPSRSPTAARRRAELGPEQEVRRLQHRPDHQRRALREGAARPGQRRARVVEGHVRRLLGRGQRPAVGAAPQRRDEPRGVGAAVDLGERRVGRGHLRGQRLGGGLEVRPRTRWLTSSTSSLLVKSVVPTTALWKLCSRPDGAASLRSPGPRAPTARWSGEPGGSTAASRRG